MAKESRTLFVRNLPFTATKDKLEDAFSEVGPIKQCFIVTEPGTEKSKGYGYVQFTLREDAITAKQTLKYMDGRLLAIDYADITRKSSHKKRNRPQDDKQQYDEERFGAGSEKKQDVVPESTKEDPPRKRDGGNESSQPSDPDMYSKVKYHKAKIIVVSSLPADTSEGDVDTFLLRLNVKHAGEVKMERDGKAHVKFKCIRDAKRAIRKLDKKTYRDCMLRAVQLSEENRPMPHGNDRDLPHVHQRKCKVIVRNLSYKCTEADLRKAFGKCGSITEAKIPTNADGQVRGFGFVQFTCLKDANTAIDTMNGVKLLGRPVAVDWAIPKDRFESAKAVKADEGDDESDSDASDASTDNAKTSQPGSQNKPSSAGSAKKAIATKKARLSSESEESSSDEEESSDSDEESGDEEGDSDEDSVDQSSDSGNGSDSDTDSEGGKKEKDTPKPVKSDVDQGKTIFIRNLAFECDDEGLTEHFQQYGELVYSRVVINPKTEHSQGIGFVKFQSKASVDQLLEKAKTEDVMLQNRSLILSVAVTREQSASFNEKKKKEKKDNRNLYLAREGMIRPGTQAAEGLSTDDLERRSKVESVKRQKLKNDNIFISPLRLCVRNIPATVTDKELRALFREAAGDKKATVNECRIMRDLARTNSKGLGKSLGFGFVGFTEHEHALAALRHANNNPDIFESNKRLIVEFSLENRKALEAKEKRKEKMQIKQQAASQEKTGAHVSSQRRVQGKSVKTGKIPMLSLSDKDKKARAENPGPKGLPSHWGPKIRHTTRPSQQQAKKGKKAKNQGRNVTTNTKPESKKRPIESSTEGPARKKQRNKYKVDSFDAMVNKYKQTLVSNKKAGGSKWFE